jgi:hypothetical protein
MQSGIDADPLAFEQAVFGQPLQQTQLNLVMDFQRQAASSAAQPGMIRHSLALAKAQEISQRQAVRARHSSPRSLSMPSK